MAFTQGNTLKEHILIHEGKKPHLCDYCGHEFRSKLDILFLNGHMIYSYAQRRKQTVYYLTVNLWVRALGPCLLLLQSA